MCSSSAPSFSPTATTILFGGQTDRSECPTTKGQSRSGSWKSLASCPAKRNRGSLFPRAWPSGSDVAVVWSLPLPSNWSMSWLREPHHGGHHQDASADQHQAHDGAFQTVNPTSSSGSGGLTD